MDPLSELLILSGAKATVSTGLVATGRWAVHVPATRALKCNMVREGACRLDVDDMRYDLGPGDCFLVAPDYPFVIGTDLSRAQPAADVFATGADGLFAELGGGVGPSTRCVGGRMELGKTAELLTDALPPVVLLRASQAATKHVEWLFDRIEAETAEARPGSDAIAAAAMQIIFVELMRTLSDDAPKGLLSALRDPRIAPALLAIHDAPVHPWSLQELAGRANLSRSQFAARFRNAVGRAPMAYVLRWRMTLAQQALSQPGVTVSQVAAKMGYASDSAFGAAFKRVTGSSPRALTLRPSEPVGSDQIVSAVTSIIRDAKGGR